MKPESLHTMIRELVSGHTHREILDDGRVHRLKVPALLDQLNNPIGFSTAEGSPRSPFGSKPVARLEALDALTQIDHDAAQWVRSLGQDDPGTTAACVRRLYSLLPSADDVTVKDVEKDICRWWTWARCVTGWDQPPFRPRASCPLCDERGSLRIRIAEKIGTCTNCRETWDAGTLALLGEHIRLANGEAA